MWIAALMGLVAVQDAPRAPRDATVASPAKDADGTQRWSILADPCAADTRGQDEIVVCGTSAATTPRLPLPGERGPPDRPIPSNPEVTGSGALAVQSAPCATRSEGCTVGVDLFGAGTTLIRGVGMLIDPGSCCEEPGEATNVVMLAKDIGSAVGRAFKKKPDKSKRVPIPLDDLPGEDAKAENVQPAP
jgi:hypothetical protein